MTASDQIQTPRRWTMDHFGAPDDCCRPGDYLRSPTGKVFLVLSARPVKVRVSRGETLRQRLEVVPWPDEVPLEARIYDFEPFRRQKPRPTTLKDLDR